MNSVKKNHAQALRKNAMSYRDIEKTLGVSRSTISLWCRHIALTSNQKSQLKLQQIERSSQGRARGTEMNKMKKAESILSADEVAKKLLRNLSQRDKLMLSIGLYWGEGSRTIDNKFVFTNSDPSAIRAIIYTVKKDFNISKTEFVPRIYINSSHMDREETLLDYWSRELCLPRDQFGRVSYIHTQSKKEYSNRDNYYGTLRLSLRRGTKTKYLFIGLINAAKKVF